MQILRDAGSLYMRKIFLILFIILVYILPLMLTYLTITTYISVTGDPLTSNMISFLLYLLLFFLLSIPFASMVKQELNDGETTLPITFSNIVDYIIPVLLIGGIYGLVVIVGLNLLIVPGLICLVLLFLFPFAYVIEGCSWKQALKKAKSIGGERFFQLLSSVLLIFLTNVIGKLLGSVAYTGLGDARIVLITQLGFYSFILPVHLIYISYYYLEFRPQHVNRF